MKKGFSDFRVVYAKTRDIYITFLENVVEDANGGLYNRPRQIIFKRDTEPWIEFKEVYRKENSLRKAIDIMHDNWVFKSNPRNSYDYRPVERKVHDAPIPMDIHVRHNDYVENHLSLDELEVMDYLKRLDDDRE